MEGIQSWSTFEQQQQHHHQNNNHNTSSIIGYPPPPTPSADKGIEALYVSSSSTDIAPAAASLLRHSGLTATTPNNNNNNNNNKSKRSLGNNAEDLGFDSQRNEKEEEFRLRFHWMRPHPSLAFALEEELTSSSSVGARQGGGETDNLNNCGIKSDDPEEERKTSIADSPDRKQINPAIESARIMEAYRSSQLEKQFNIATTNGMNSDEEEDVVNATELTSTSRNLQHLEKETPNLPLELPKLRIDLASLVEPPLMSSWLPGEDVCIDSDSDDYDSDDDEDHDNDMDK